MPAPAMPHNGVVTLREVYALVEARSDKVLAEIKAVETNFEAWIATHHAEHKAEEQAHSSRTRWAVTTILSGAGIAVAIVLPIVNNK